MDHSKVKSISQDLQQMSSDLSRAKDMQAIPADQMWHQVFNNSCGYMGLTPEHKQELTDLLENVARGFVAGKVPEYEKAIREKTEELKKSLEA